MVKTNDTAEVPLQDGMVTFIDAEDLERVSQYKWYLCGRNFAKRRTHYVHSSRRIEGKQVSLHRFILNAKAGQIIDHADGDTLNNRKSNLRFCTYTQNMMNRGRLSNIFSVNSSFF